jgi:beta-lactamase regulating signal transducer with metallopeptidase domain
MIAAWIVYSLAVGAVAAGLAALLHALRRNSGFALRWIWASAILATIGLSATAPWRVEAPIMRISLDSATPGSSSIVMAPPSLLDRTRSVVGQVIATTTAPLGRVMSATSHLPTRVQRTAFVGCIALAIAALLWLVAIYLRTLSLRRSWARDEMLGVAVRVAPDVGPAVIGVAPPEIVVPRWLMERAPSEQQLVLEHEQAHVRAHDPLLLLGACAAVALMPWNPALWYLLSRLRLAVEMDCDRRVLRAGAPTRSYAQLLIELSAHRSLLTPAVLSFSHSVSHLERRLLAMTTRPNRASLSVRLGAALLTAVALLAACESKLPTSAEVQDMTAASATKRAGFMVTSDTAKTVYLLDGKEVSKAEAEAIASGRIASIDVTRASAEKKADVVRIVTQAAADTAKPVLLKRRAAQSDSVVVKIAALKKRAAEGDTAARAELQMASGRPMRTMLDNNAQTSVKPSPKANTKAFDGLLLLNGEVTDASNLQSIDPATIETVEVVKGAAATAKYSDPRAANGVIVITLKKKS